MQYLMVIEKGDNNFSAYFPDLPGCVATGGTVEEVRANLTGALIMHLKGLAEDNEPAPLPLAIADYVEATGITGETT